MEIGANMLTAIGRTPLVRLQRVVPADCATILVKVEGHNPTGSMKDRMAQAMIAAAEADGRLPPGGTVVEYTGGSTGAALALVCAVRGYRLRIVSSAVFSEDKLIQMAALGAELTLIPSANGQITKQLIHDMIDTAAEFGRRPDTYWTDQLTNTAGIAGYHSMGEEIWAQTAGRVDGFVQAVGTAASLRGATTPLRQHNPRLRVVAVEPAESAVLSGGNPGAHLIEGIGIGYEPPMWDPDLPDEIIPVPTADAEAMARRLAKEEALFTGTSSGANIVAAIELGRRLGPDATIATIAVDSGLKYLSTTVFRASRP
ncbi:PLP-dependent cysteine synthase family protein [Nocardia vulneris]|uniref:Cysteine synthase n=1 Tax=Nocardia vulneris TaxID=1141657 RepID=A0ABR4ZF78_9NOCA|nr:cysteine synthase family protein [Nocardia vulneris]KIA63664.1 cysteine synthase [Nocardia vulneris]